MKATRPLLAVAGAFTLWVSCLGAYGGPNHEAAMAIVHQGESVSGTGNLDAAMEVYRSVEDRFPEESEAIGWGRYRISECLVAGGRWAEACVEAGSAYRLSSEGKVQNPDFAFWSAYQYARCLDRISDRWNLAQVAREVADLYAEYPEKTEAMDNAYGWARFFSARCFYAKGQHEWASEAAGEAFEVGKQVKNGSLASAARCLQGQVAQGDGDLLLAHQILLECREDYVPHENAAYGDLVSSSLALVEEALGLDFRARESVLTMLSNPSADEGYALKATADYAEASMARGATMEALGPLLIGWAVLPHVPQWNSRMDLLLGEIAERVPAEAFEDALGSLADGAENPLEEASIRLRLALLLAERGDQEAGAVECARASAACEEPRLNLRLRLAEKACGGPNQQPEIAEIYLDEIRNAQGDRGRIEYAVQAVRDQLRQSAWDPRWPEWLDSHQDLLPRDLYLLEKGLSLRDGSREYEQALAAFEEILAMPGVDHWAAHLERIVCLHMMWRPEEAAEATADYEDEIADAGRREYGFFLLARALTRANWKDEALAVLDRIIESGKTETWYRDALLKKAKLLRSKGDTAGAVTELQELVTLPPLYDECRGGIVGEGYNLLAWITHRALGDTEGACAVLQAVIAAPDAMPLAQAEAYRLYTSILDKERNSERAIEVAEQGLSVLPVRHQRPRAWLEAVRLSHQYRLGMATAEEMETLAAEVEEKNDLAASLIRRTLRGEVQ